MPSASDHVGNAQASYHLPVETLVLRPNNPQNPSILDTVFTSRRTRSAAYATTTEGSETRVWRVDKGTGEMEEIAKIGWDMPTGLQSLPGDGLRSIQLRNKQAAMISHGGRTMSVDDFLRKAKGWFPSEYVPLITSSLPLLGSQPTFHSSKTFTSPVNGVSYKWKSGPERTTIPDATRPRHSNTPRPESWKRWRCVTANGAPHPTACSGFNSSSSPLSHSTFRPSRGGNHNMAPLERVPSYRSTSSDHSNQPGEAFPPGLRSLLSSPAPPSLVARFAPPQPGLLKYELTIFPAAYPPYTSTPDGMVDTLVVTAILLTADKDEWRTRQSIMDARSLAAHFEAEARGVVPPYTPRAPRTVEISARPRTAEERLRDQYVLTMNGTLRPLPPYYRPSEPPPSVLPAPSSFPSNRLRTESETDLLEPLFRYAAPPDSGRSRSGSASSPPSRWLAWGSTWVSQRRPRTAQGFERNRSGAPPPSYVQLETQISHQLQR